MKDTRARKRNFLISCSIFLCFFLLTILADRAAGFFIKRPLQVSQGIIFPPSSKQNYRTPEFAFTAHINSLGFRDREFDNPTIGGTRIVAIGDSFTYGWGVEINQSWTKVLEENLRKKGYALEVANLGQPGASPKTYAEIAEKAAPLLKPDLLVVAVLQGDDLASLSAKYNQTVRKTEGHENQGQLESDNSLLQSLSKVSYRLYPNFLSLLKGRAFDQPLQTLWREQAQRVIDELTPEEKLRFDNLDGQVKNSFENGELNPALLQAALKFPEFFLENFDTNEPETRLLILEMARQLARIKEAAHAQHSQVIVVSIPYKVYASPRDLESSRRLGLLLTPEMAVSTSADEAIKAACVHVGLEFFEVTAGFRGKALESHLFFDLDGHFNSSGHQTFADLLTPILEQRLRMMKKRSANSE
ncbi:MAG: hypothetical protein H0T60_03025 [Acidobacteria bacterium]|nr:hypothetical protein [Acidobacteriota bacterium]